MLYPGYLTVEIMMKRLKLGENEEVENTIRC